MMKLCEIKNTSHFKKRISQTLTDENIVGKDAIQFINSIRDHFEVYLVGGAIRNIFYNEEIRDLDLIISAAIIDNPIIQKSLPKNFVFNRMGGIKLSFTKVTIDAWSIYENWANKNKLVGENIITKEIAKGSFYNFDSLVFAVNSKALNCENYNKCVRTQMLDIITHKRRYVISNPNRAANILRAFYLNKKYNLRFSSGLNKYINSQLHYLALEHTDLNKYLIKMLKSYSKYNDALNENVLLEMVSLFLGIKNKKSYPNSGQLF